jgi:choline-glycine betaine transporter
MGVLGLFPTNALSILSPINGFVMYFALFCVLFCIINLFNGDRVPGEKEYSNASYFNLLFTLGMGVGIMVYGFNEAPQLAGYSDVRNPIGLTLNHWTIIPWALYVTFAIFEIYDQKYNLLPTWLGTIKTYIYGLMMMLGIGTSFALGVITISDAVNTIYGIDIPSYALVIFLGAIVTFSLLRGIHKGMKMMAKYAMILLYVFIGFLIIMSPADTISAMGTAVKSFFGDFLYNNIYTARAVQQDWTVYYWIWWISWAAFTAPFIATISKGRTIRSVVIFTVIIPSILITIFMGLGNYYGMTLLNSGVEIGMIPFKAIDVHWVIPILFILLMAMFYITSSDSQSFAMDQLISKGSKTPIVYRKILWVFLEVVFVTVLLLVGGNTISALQGLSFLCVPLMILFAIIYVVKLVILYVNSKKVKR